MSGEPNTEAGQSVLNTEQTTVPRRFKKHSDERAAVGWKKGTIDEHAPSGLAGYEEGLGFNREDLRGKTVLDLGTDNGDSLARDLDAAGIDVKVISVSPDFTNETVREAMPYYSPDWKMKNGVAAIAQKLPFRDGTFDVVLSQTAVTYAASTSPQQVKAWTTEVGRVLKPGGVARIGPTYGDSFAFGKKYDHLIEYAKDAGLEIEIVNGTADNGLIVLKKPDKPIDEAGNDIKEQEIEGIPFRQLIAELVAKYPQKKEEGKMPLTSMFFSSVGKEPFLAAGFDPNIFFGRTGYIARRDYMVNSGRVNSWTNETGATPFELAVYNVPVDQLKDPNFKGEIEKMAVDDVLVAPDQLTADRIGSWIADPKVRQHIVDYRQNERRVGDIMKLRLEGTYDDAAAKSIEETPYPELSDLYSNGKQ